MMHPDPALLEATAESYFAGSDGCHDFDHTLRVRRNALELCRMLPEARKEIVEAAALLHDIGRPEEDRARGCGCCHAAKGAEMAKEILLRQGCDTNFAAAVSRAIACHRFRGELKPETLEEKILYDADKLDSLGAVGLGRAFLFAGNCGAKLHNSTTEALAGEAYGRDDTAWREYLVKLRHLPDRMLTTPGRTLGRKRLEFMEEFFRILAAETGIS